MATYTANQVSINNGSKLVTVNSNESPESVSQGDFIQIANYPLAEINRAFLDANSNHIIELVKVWKHSDQTTQPAIVVPTTVDFKATVDALKKANILVNDNTKEMQAYQTDLGEVNFKNIDETTTTVKTLKQIQLESDSMAESLSDLISALGTLKPEELALILQSAVNFKQVMESTDKNFEDLFYNAAALSQVTLNYGYFANKPGLVRLNNGQVSDDENWLYSDMYKIDAGDVITMNLYTAGSLAALAFYNDDGMYISGVASTFEDQQVTVPDGTTQFRICRGNPEVYAAAAGKPVKVEVVKKLIDIPKIEKSTQIAITNAHNAIQESNKIKSITNFFDLHLTNHYGRKLNLSGGKKAILYGDSISSSDYPWAAQRMAEITGGQVYAAGIPGATMGQLTTQPRMDRIFNYNPDLIVIFAGGNDTGRDTTVGTFSGYVEGEQIVPEIDISGDYNGTYNIQAMDYIVRKIKSYYYDIRSRANLTGNETEEEKTAKIDALAMPQIVLCTPIPQNRYTFDHVYSQPANWKRKRDCVIEVARKNNIHCVDLFTLWGQQVDMSKEPYWETPTNVSTNNGIYLMDGLHPNKWGANLWVELLAASIGL